jgi:4-hydroxy-3-methylbut-2-enyl diphosphate reductase
MLEVRETSRLRDDKQQAGTGQRPQLLVLLAAPRGFCAGVQRAIDAVRDALAVHGAPVYVRRPIVHNLDVVRSLESEGAVFVQELDQVPPGSVVLFSAHGVAPAIARDAERRGLIAFDAVCPLVSKVHREVERHSRDGRQIVLIGHQGHPEIDGTLGHVGGGGAFVISSVDEVAELPLADDKPTAYAVQTTYSVEEASGIVEALHKRFPDLTGPTNSDICYATTNRQQAVRGIAARADAVIVAGEEFSSNACRLAEVAREYCDQVQLVTGPEQVDWGGLPPRGVVGITAAASTPDSAVRALLSALSDRYDIEVEEVESARETTVFKRMAVA